MTQHKIKVLEDGTRVYSNYTRYKPMADAERTNKINRPDDPRAVRFHALWFLPLELLPDEEREMPDHIWAWSDTKPMPRLKRNRLTP